MTNVPTYQEMMAAPGKGGRPDIWGPFLKGLEPGEVRRIPGHRASGTIYRAAKRHNIRVRTRIIDGERFVVRPLPEDL